MAQKILHDAQPIAVLVIAERAAAHRRRMRGVCISSDADGGRSGAASGPLPRYIAMVRAIQRMAEQPAVCTEQPRRWAGLRALYRPPFAKRGGFKIGFDLVPGKEVASCLTVQECAGVYTSG
jgi:hypothetical protein